MRRGRRALVGALAALALGLAGCGGDDGASAEDFKRDFAQVNDQILAIGDDIGNGISSARGETDAELAREFAGLAKRARAAKTRLDGLEPPEDLEDERDRLSAALERGAADLTDIAAAARTHDAKAARSATQRLVRDSPPIRNARRALARKTGATLGN